MHPLVLLAIQSVEEFILHRTTISPPDTPSPEMNQKAGVFVCLKKFGELRGCIGTFLPCTDSVAEETIRNSIAAATQDPRFGRVSADELPDLSYTVDVLSPPEKVASVDELDAKRYGVIVSSGMRRGLLLPDLEGVDTPLEQLRIAKMKAGIREGEPVEIFRFRVDRYT